MQLRSLKGPRTKFMLGRRDRKPAAAFKAAHSEYRR
jgi:hypothetical protein